MTRPSTISYILWWYTVKQINLRESALYAERVRRMTCPLVFLHHHHHSTYTLYTYSTEYTGLPTAETVTPQAGKLQYQQKYPLPVNTQRNPSNNAQHIEIIHPNKKRNSHNYYNNWNNKTIDTRYIEFLIHLSFNLNWQDNFKSAIQLSKKNAAIY